MWEHSGYKHRLEQCDMRKHTFWDDAFGDLLNYLCKSRPWWNKIVTIAHNAKAFDVYVLLNRAILLKWKPKVILNGLKISCMKMENITIVDSVSFMPFFLSKLPEAFGLTSTKSWYTHYFNTKKTWSILEKFPMCRSTVRTQWFQKERDLLAW